MKQRTRKLTAGLLVLTVVMMGLFTGCKMTQEDAIQMYKDSFAKSKEMENYKMTSAMDLEMGISDMSIAIKMDMESAVADKGNTASHRMNMSTMGEEQTMEMYQQGEFMYTSIPGLEGKYIKQSYEESTGMSYQGLMDLNSGEMADSYIQAIDQAENLTFEQLENKDVHIAFDFSQASLDALRDDLTSVLEETMLGGMEQQLQDQFSVMGLEEAQVKELVAQMMEAYRSMFSTIGVESIHMDMTMNKAGFVVGQDMQMVLTMDMSGLFAALGQDVDEATKNTLKDIKLTMDVQSTISDINSGVTVTLPEFADDNTMTPAEATALTME